jgi:hypothetical protein
MTAQSEQRSTLSKKKIGARRVDAGSPVRPVFFFFLHPQKFLSWAVMGEEDGNGGSDGFGRVVFSGLFGPYLDIPAEGEVGGLCAGWWWTML